MYGVPQGSILGPLFFNIHICDMFFQTYESELSNYADDTTPYTHSDNINNLIEKLENSTTKLFEWFKDNHMKANPEKCHLLVIKAPLNTKINITDNYISCSTSEKLLGITLDNNLLFDKHVSSLCKKAQLKLHALSRIARYITFNKRRLIMKAFIQSQFSYCPLVWMFHSRKTNKTINRLHERALRLVYEDNTSTFTELLEKDKSVTIHQKNLQLLAIEIFKAKHNLSPVIMREVFKFEDHIYNTRSTNNLKRPKTKTVRYTVQIQYHTWPRRYGTFFPKI